MMDVLRELLIAILGIAVGVLAVYLHIRIFHREKDLGDGGILTLGVKDPDDRESQ